MYFQLTRLIFVDSLQVRQLDGLTRDCALQCSHQISFPSTFDFLTGGCDTFCDEEILPEILPEIGNKDVDFQAYPRLLFSEKVSPPARAGASISARVLLPHTRAKKVAAR